MSNYIYKPEHPSKHLELMLEVFDNLKDYSDMRLAKEFTNSKMIFAIDVDNIGVDLALLTFIKGLKEQSLKGSDAILLVASQNEVYSKSFAQQVILLLNNLGCQFVGRPMVEAISDLKNMITPAKVGNCSREEALTRKCIALKQRFLEFKYIPIRKPKLLVVHTSNKATSNTLKLWSLVEQHLDYEISEIHIENNEIKDCNGCSYDVCSYFGQTNSCIYKGKIIEEVFPKLLESDALVLLSPNYNDSISAQLMAFINRLTSLFTKYDFYDKTLYAVIVSGFSGSDCIAKQLISAIAINKQFRLPPQFALTQIANEKGSLVQIEDIETVALNYANHIKNTI